MLDAASYSLDLGCRTANSVMKRATSYASRARRASMAHALLAFGLLAACSRSISVSQIHPSGDISVIGSTLGLLCFTNLGALELWEKSADDDRRRELERKYALRIKPGDAVGVDEYNPRRNLIKARIAIKSRPGAVGKTCWIHASGPFSK
jgi:hypothetical protein